MKLFLARHGNTFEPETEPVWIGSRTNLNLSKKGFEQAKELAETFKELNIRFDQIYAASLIRTKIYAEIIAKELNFTKEVLIKTELLELDYGNWEGKSNQEIQASSMAEDLKLWSENSSWPKNSGWTQKKATIRAETLAFAKSYENLSGNFLCISSNGRLRYFLDLIPVETINKKVNTGNICLLEFKNNSWQLKFWNISPKELRGVCSE